MIFLLFLFLLGASAQELTCSWACDDPVCHPICQPKCQEPPRCEISCTNPLATCAAPSCRVICPIQNTTVDSCPMCETQCTPLHCSESSGCQILCEPPVCGWDCRNPLSCPAPRCELMCQQPACRASSGSFIKPFLVLGLIILLVF